MRREKHNVAPVKTPGPSWPEGCWPSEEQQWLLLACLTKDDIEAHRAFLRWERMVPLELADTGSVKLLLVLYNRVKSWKSETRSLPWLKGSARYSWVKHQMIVRNLESIIRTFREAGIDTLLLKGAALNVTVYPEGQRLMSDLDVAVPREHAEEAVSLLIQSGWTSKFRNPEKMIDAAHGCHFEKGPAAQLDLHWDFFHGRYLDSDEQSILWNAAKTVSVGKETVRVLCPADQLLHTCEHGVRYNESSPPFRWLADAWHILENSGEAIDFERLARLSSRFKLRPQVRNSLTFLERLLPGTVPREEFRKLTRQLVSLRQEVENAIVQRHIPATHYLFQSLPGNFVNFWRRKSGGQRTGLGDYLAIVSDFDPPLRNSLPSAWKVEKRALTERLEGLESSLSNEYGLRRFPMILVPEHRLEGVYPPEVTEDSSFRWTQPRAGIALPLRRAPYDISVRLLPVRPAESYSRSLSVRLNRSAIAGDRTRIEGHCICFPVEPSMFLDYPFQRLELQCEDWCDAKSDPRLLGLPIVGIEVRTRKE